MERAVVRITLIGLMVALAATLPNKDDWNIYSFHINSTVSSRYATTVITSRVANRMAESKEVEFHVRIPKNAFITKFRMFIDGQVYDGNVKEKEQAQRQYTTAVSRGQSAGIVSSVGRTLEEFKTSVTVSAHNKVTFELTYEELMKRTLGKYELQIHARPMQPVKDFKIDVHIQEKAGISFLDVKGGLSTNALANAITRTQADKKAWVHFYPTEDQQKACDSCDEQGLNGDLVIVYDVNRNSTLGDIMISKGYFVHHFAPSSHSRIPKNVVFIIDRSGSMRGRKIEQTRTALIHILGDLAEDDYFGLITFNNKIFHWKQELVQANSANLDSAKNFAREISDRGGTDINRAVLEGSNMLNAHPREGSASLLILLTDGDPTSGETNIERIHSNVRQAIAGKFPLYCLGFGFDVNFEFLEKMALQNNGVARRIYEESDAAIQLKGFYEEVATPLLTNVTMSYKGGSNLTQTVFSQYYNGSEIVVAGQIDDNNIDSFIPQAVAITRTERKTFSETNNPVETSETVSDNQTQRVWAYLTVKQLLQKELLMSGPEKEEVKKNILELSLKYSFVTPHTSMVVTKPPGETADVLDKPKEGKQESRISGNPLQGALPPPPAPRLHRFLITTETMALSICFDVPGDPFIKLLHHPSRELFVNGELDSETTGVFQKIVIHFEADKYVEVDVKGATIRVGENTTRLTGDDVFTNDSLTVITRSKEIDIAAGDARIVIIVHEKAGREFLWPVMRQKPSATNIEGLLALKPAEYEDIKDFPVVTKKMKDQEFPVTSDIAVNYSVTPPETMICWLSPADSALERPLNDFFVAQL
ncbi:inter-alpha-trypsin inhibitor heavy chain H3-like [Salarias fasciatus]|uniref:inter-alpha-trypsin inhibitor heavy chain H3-like n=1 Tax=Salarias fasciatus TaxID=181472 RepID=UPI001176BF62|nr:inter-alpha-trypsin inhibitor heavy chain H3-like [Salarias fasciatus]